MNLFSFIKQSAPILTVVQDFVRLKKAGHYWKGHCPFHSEKTASFTVSPHKEIFYCFGCQAGGDVISFISKVEHCNSLQAASYLADRYGIAIPKEIAQQSAKQSKEEQDEKKRYWFVCTKVAQWCHQHVKKYAHIQRYLKNRGIDEENSKRFAIGYFPGGLHNIKSLIQYAQSHNILLNDLIKANILFQGKKVLYSPFEERIIFPIKDHIGHYVAFGGRIFKKDDARPKYYNSKENPYFNKRAVLFGLNAAKQAITNSEKAFLVEGYTDCIAMAQHGYKNVVATLGTACTIEHLSLLSRYANTLYVLYDGDKAGQHAIIRLAQLCWQTNIELNVIQLPEQEDPASYLEKHGNLDAILDKARDIFAFYIEASGKDFITKPLHQKVNLARTVLETIAHITDPLKQDMLVQKCANTFDIPFEPLKRELGRLKSKTPAKAPQTNKTQQKTADSTLDKAVLKKIPELEKQLFSVIINNDAMIDEEEEGYLITYLTNPLPQLWKKLRSILNTQGTLDFMQAFDVLNEQEKELMSQILITCHDIDAKQSANLIAQFQKKHWKHFVNDVKTKLSQAQKDHDRVAIASLMNHYQALKKKLIEKGLI